MAINFLQTVQTYQMAGLAYLDNLNCFISTANKKFKDFEKLTGNLGDTVTFDRPPRFTTTNSLVATFQSADQLVQTLTVDQAANTAYSFTAQQFIFNVQEYMEKFGKSAIREIGAKVEANVAQRCVTNTYRFYGNGIAPINSFQQLASALSLFRNFGASNDMAKGYLQDTSIPNIVNSGLSQFAMDRNNELANSWELGKFSNCEWYQSNLLPIHYAGTEGVSQTTLTVVSTTLDANGAVIAITFSGTTSASDANSVKKNDKFQFQDGVSGQTNLRFRTYIGHEVSSVPVQFRATADAQSTGGSQVTVSVYPPLQVQPTNSQNINVAIQAGMTVLALPSHRAGLICAGKPFFLAMPQLPEEVPFPTAAQNDPETGTSMRQYYGSLFGQNQRGMVHDCIWGSTLVDDYSMSVIYPL